MKRSTRNSLLLMLTALIWGIAFVAQTTGGDAIGPFSFSGIRCIIGALALSVAIPILDRMGLTARKPVTREEKLFLLKAGLIVGLIFFLAANMQQVAISMGASTGKAGFLTACYSVMVPVLGVFLGKKCGLNIWIGVGLTFLGLYLLCINGAFVLTGVDTLLLLCALFFSFHILAIDHYSPLLDGVRLARLQFIINAILSLIVAAFTEIHIGTPAAHDWLAALATADAWIALLYAGVCSCGIAYTLQIVGQQDVNPTIASIIMSLEAVFSALAGWLILKQYLSLKQITGCALIFAAVVLAQIEFPIRKKK